MAAAVLYQKPRVELLQEAIDADLSLLATRSGLTSDQTRKLCRRLQKNIEMRNALREPGEVRKIERMKGIA